MNDSTIHSTKARSATASTWLSLSLLLAAGPAGSAAATENSGAIIADTSERRFDIPPQALTAALNAFAETAQVQLSFPSELAKGKSSPGVEGRYKPMQALEKLLEGSGLEFRITPNQSITLQQPRTQSLTTEQLLAAAGEFVLAKAEPEEEPYVGPVEQEDLTVSGSEWNPYVMPNATSGTKTDTPIMETPLNVQVIADQVLKDQQVISLDQALRNVSGVKASSNTSFNGSTQQSITIRGFSSQTFFRNGFRLQQGAPSRAMANVESVEVLKGPAAILYGQVEPGGMVNVITKQPLSTPYYAFNQQFGSFSHYRTTLDAGGPLTKDDTLLYRMNLSYQNSGSFREFAGKEDIFVAPVIKWNISPRTQATFEMEYNRLHTGQDTGFVPLLDGKIIKMPRSRNYTEYQPNTTETFFGAFNWSHQFNDNWSVKHGFAVNQQSNDSKFDTHPIALSAVDLSRAAYRRAFQYDTYSTNLDVTGHFETWGLKHTFLIGGDYYRLDTTDNTVYSWEDPAAFAFGFSTISLYDPVHPGTPNTGTLEPTIAQTKGTDQFGFYVQDQIELPHRVHIMGGIRYQNLHQHNTSRWGDAFPLPATETALSQDAVTPRIGILWQAQDWLSLYANYVENFGANQGTVYPNKPIAPSSATQYEGGIKTEFFDGRLRASWAYYDLTKTNIATSDLAHPGFSLAIGAVNSRGTEFDIQGEILPGWNMIANYAYQDIRTTEGREGNSGSGPGTRFYNAPRNLASLWTTYEFQNGPFKGFKFGGGTTIRDGQTGCCDSPAASIPGYVTVDLLAAYSLKVGTTKISAQLNVYNLLDKYYYSALATQGVGLAGYHVGFADFGTPRSFMGSINIQY